MNKRHVQSFLMVSAAFFAMNLPVRPAGAATEDRMAAAVSHMTRIASACVGNEPGEASASGDELAAKR